MWNPISRKLGKTRKLTLTGAIAGLLFICFPSEYRQAQAGEVPMAAILENALTLYFVERPEALPIFRRLFGSTEAIEVLSASERLNLLQKRLEDPRLVGERLAIETRLRRAATELEEFNASRGTKIPEQRMGWSAGEKAKLNEILARNFIDKPLELEAGATGNHEIKFFEVDAAAETLALQEAQFARPNLKAAGSRGKLPDLVPETAALPLAEREIGSKSFWELMNKVQNCQLSLTAEQSIKNGFVNWAVHTGVDSLVSVAATVVAAGSQDVLWKNLPADLIEGAANEGINSAILTLGQKIPEGQRFKLTWFMLSAAGVPQATGGAVLYYFMPIKDTEGASAYEATVPRFGYDMLWNQAYAPVQVKLYDLFSRLRCAFPGGKGARIVLGTQVATSFGINWAYYGMRPIYKRLTTQPSSAD